MNGKAKVIMRLLEFTDSAFPVGTFSFSNGLESAAEEGLVYDAATLAAYTRDMAHQAAYSDGIAALHASRCVARNDYEGILEADLQAIMCRMNAEARLMACRMGKKLAELAVRIIPEAQADGVVARWLGDITAGRTAGTYPVAQGLVFAVCGIAERELFCSHQYGVINMILSAALRCVRVSHYDTQRILYELSGETDALFDEVRTLDFEDMNLFVPQADILAALHEKGTKRMFMN